MTTPQQIKETIQNAKRLTINQDSSFTKQLRFFFNNEFLSDITLSEKDKTYHMHKLALAAKSNYFFQYFQQNPTAKSLELPQYIQSTYQKNHFTHEITESILKTFYQTHLTPLEGFIHAGLERHNCFLFYSIAQSLQMHEVQEILQAYILEQLKDDFNVVFGVLRDAIKMSNPAVAGMARSLIAKKFQKILEQRGLEKQIYDIPFQEFLGLVKNDKLNVKNESQVFQQVLNYIDAQESLEENKDWNYKYDEDGDKKEDEGKGEEVDGNGEKEDELDEDKINFGEDLDSKAAGKLKMYKLTPLQKMDLLEAVKLNFVNNEDLLMASQKEEFQSYKDIFLKAISTKLQQVENPGSILPSEPRESYKEQIMQNQSQLVKSKQYLLGQSQFGHLSQQTLDYIENMDNSKVHPNIYVITQDGQIPANLNLSGLKKTQYANANKQTAQTEKQNNSNVQFLGMEANKSVNHDQDYSWVQNRKSYGEFKGQGNANTLKKQTQLTLKYERDFDTNGAFYYLGTCGKKKPYQNPHESGQCKVLISSIRTGRLQDFVGREVTNLSTVNEKNSYVGVDLGKDRYLFPSCYTLRNRNSSTHVCFNWCLEGSVNGKDWYVLDKRINFSETNQRFNSMMENERQMLITRGASTTWGVDTTALMKFFEKNFTKERGFRMFKVTQLFENSHGSDNLCLSGIELYGNCYGSRWHNFEL